MRPIEEQKQELTLEGIQVSPGVAYGPAFVMTEVELDVPVYGIQEDQIEYEVFRFEQALLQTRQQITDLQAEVREKLSEEEALIFDAHLLVLEDKALIEETLSLLRTKKLNVESCFQKVSQRFIDFFANLDDAYLKERVSDIRDVTRRVLRNMSGVTDSSFDSMTEPSVLVASDITPSDAAQIDLDMVKAIVLEHGGTTGHAVIVARSMGIPAIVDVQSATQRVHAGETLLVDGYSGALILHPNPDTLYQYNAIQLEKDSIRQIFLKESTGPNQTLDGKPFFLVANIESSADLPRVETSSAEGIGLFRSEALYLRSSNEMPTEDEQFEEYRTVVKGMNGMPVTIRTLDLGGDKVFPPSMRKAHVEDNPFMGFRAIRFCLKHQDIFKVQLRALLRASAEGNLKILYPMISGVSELRQANQVLEDAKAELRARGLPFDEHVKVGAMIEIPSAAQVARELGRFCDFFSIGTNDLTQYLMAVDRVNEEVAHLYRSSHPSVIRTLKQIVDAGKEAGVPVSLCGEMAGVAAYAALLLGLGIKELSISSYNLPEIRYVLRRLNSKYMEDLAKAALASWETSQIDSLLEAFKEDMIKPVLETAIRGIGN
jgi:phosphotransferase system enzyme I (PtsI)